MLRPHDCLRCSANPMLESEAAITWRWGSGTAEDKTRTVYTPVSGRTIKSRAIARCPWPPIMSAVPFPRGQPMPEERRACVGPSVAATLILSCETRRRSLRAQASIV